MFMCFNLKTSGSPGVTDFLCVLKCALWFEEGKRETKLLTGIVEANQYM